MSVSFSGIVIETKGKALCLSALYFLLHYDYENFNESYFSMNMPTECFRDELDLSLEITGMFGLVQCLFIRNRIYSDSANIAHACVQ